MQIIQPLLGNNIHPLGLRSSLSHPHGMLLRKESHLLNSRSNFISSIQTKPPLVTSSKFLLSREHEASIQPLIGWDSWDTQDINNEFPLVDLDSSDSRTPLKNSNINSSEPIKSSIPEIMPTRIDNNTSNNTSSEIKIKGKSKSKKINKSQQPPEKKSTPKSQTKKTVKSSATKLVDKSKIPINFNEDSLLASDEPLPVEANLELPTLQLDIASDNITNDRDSIGIITPSITAPISPSFEDKSTLFRNIANGEVQANPELTSSLPNAQSSLIESISQLQQKKKLDDNVNELAETSLIEFYLPNNIEETFTPPLLIKNEPKIITEASESVNISDIPVSLTPIQQDSETDQFTSIVDNQTTTLPTNLIQKKEVLPILNPPSPEEESPHTNSNFEEITAIESDLILESNTNDFVTDNSVENAALSSVFTSLNVDDTLHVLANAENTVGAHSYVPLPNVGVPNSKSSVAKKPIAIQQEIISSVTSESPGSTPVQLTPISADIEDTPSLFTNSDNNEQLVTVNVLDVSANVTSLQHDSNLENTASESTESYPILALPEISETPTISAISPQIAETGMFNDKPLDIYAPLPTTSPEISETPTISAISPQIAETGMFNDKPLDIYAPLPTTSPEISETPTITAISAEIAETGMSNDKPLDIYAPLPTTSPEISQVPTITAISPEIAETGMFNDKPLDIYAPLPTTSPEISETPTITAISPQIAETAMSNDKPLDIYAPLPSISPEISQVPTITAISPQIAETGMSNDKPLDIYAPLPSTSPEISQVPTITAISPEIAETGMSNDKPLDIYAPLPTISPEISEAPTITAISPEIDNIPVVSATPPEIGATASIFRKILDNEQPVKSEFSSAVTNPEISTFIDTSDNLDISEETTSPQNEVSTPPQVEQNAIAENLPASKGYATGGHVIDSRVENRQQIAPSDTVPAMLTPGEFVINTRDAQKNLPLLHHINTGGTPQDIILPSLQTPNPTEPEETTSPETPTKVDSFPDTSLQLKSAENDSPEISNSLIPSSLGLNISKQKLSLLNSPEIHTLHNETIDVNESSPQYSSPPLIFRKANSSTNTPSQWSNTPSQWSNVEDLLNGNDDEFTSFNFNDGESNSQKSEFSHVSESPQIFAKHLPTFRGFADGGEVTLPDISREIAPVTETIESASSFSQEDDKDDTADLEALAREVYHRLRQRIEIERERHGGSSGRLPW